MRSTGQMNQQHQNSGDRTREWFEGGALREGLGPGWENRLRSLKEPCEAFGREGSCVVRRAGDAAIEAARLGPFAVA